MVARRARVFNIGVTQFNDDDNVRTAVHDHDHDGNTHDRLLLVADGGIDRGSMMRVRVCVRRRTHALVAITICTRGAPTSDTRTTRIYSNQLKSSHINNTNNMAWRWHGMAYMTKTKTMGYDWDNCIDKEDDVHHAMNMMRSYKGIMN